jgi:hypothetical protein
LFFSFVDGGIFALGTSTQPADLTGASRDLQRSFKSRAVPTEELSTSNPDLWKPHASLVIKNIRSSVDATFHERP